MKNKVIEILEDITGLSPIDENADLIDDGILDSLAFIEFINEVDDRLGIEIQPTQVDAQVWHSVERIADMLEESITCKTSDMKSAICRGGKFTTAITCFPTRFSGV